MTNSPHKRKSRAGRDRAPGGRGAGHVQHARPPSEDDDEPQEKAVSLKAKNKPVSLAGGLVYYNGQLTRTTES